MTLSQATQMPNELPCREDLEAIIKKHESGELELGWYVLDGKIEIPTSKERGMSRISWLKLNINRLTQPRELIISNRRQAIDDWLDYKLK